MRNKGILRTLTATLMTAVLCSPITALADGSDNHSVGYKEWYGTYQDRERDKGYSITAVNVNGGASTFTVTVPKEMKGVASNKAVDWTYDITVTGDLAATDMVKVEPDATFTLSQVNKPDINATVVQEKTLFRDDKYTYPLKSNEVLVSTGAKGNVKAQNLTSGTWKGSFNFNVSLERDLGTYREVDFKYYEIAYWGEADADRIQEDKEAFDSYFGVDNWKMITLGCSYSDFKSVSNIDVYVGDIATPGMNILVFCDRTNQYQYESEYVVDSEGWIHIDTTDSSGDCTFY